MTVSNGKQQTVIILGAGASIGSEFNVCGHRLPGDRGFFASPIVENLLKTGGYPALSCVLESFREAYRLQGWGTLGLEEVWSFIEFSGKEIFKCAVDLSVEEALWRSAIIKSESQREDEHCQCQKVRQEQTLQKGADVDLLMLAGWDLRRVLARVYGDLVAPENGGPYELLFEKHVRDADSTVFISLNYDTVLETALTQAKRKIDWHYAHVDKTTKRESGGVQVLKPHGSLNWRFKGNDPQVKISTDYSLEPVACRSYTDNSFEQAMIVPPTQTKQSITIEETQTSPSRKLFSDIWSEAIYALANASKIIVIGYSFPPTDLHLRTMFHLALRKRGFKSYEDVYCCTVADGGEGSVFAGAERCVPSRSTHLFSNGFDGFVT